MARGGTLRPLRDELVALGVVVVDRYLTGGAAALLARNVVFVLPYREASQSGALYSLLHHGRLVVCADSGDLGDFMRRFGLEAMLMRERSADAVADVLDRLGRDEAAIVAAFQAARTPAAGRCGGRDRSLLRRAVRIAMPQSPGPAASRRRAVRRAPGARCP
jgi:hypothetical protein